MSALLFLLLCGCSATTAEAGPDTPAADVRYDTLYPPGAKFPADGIGRWIDYEMGVVCYERMTRISCVTLPEED